MWHTEAGKEFYTLAVPTINMDEKRFYARTVYPPRVDDILQYLRLVDQ